MSGEAIIASMTKHIYAERQAAGLRGLFAAAQAVKASVSPELYRITPQGVRARWRYGINRPKMLSAWAASSIYLGIGAGGAK